MNKNNNDELSPELETHLALVKSMYERMERENSWPWVIDRDGWEQTMRKIEERQQALQPQHSNPSRGES